MCGRDLIVLVEACTKHVRQLARSRGVQRMDVTVYPNADALRLVGSRELDAHMAVRPVDWLFRLVRDLFLG